MAVFKGREWLLPDKARRGVRRIHTSHIHNHLSETMERWCFWAVVNSVICSFRPFRGPGEEGTEGGREGGRDG